MKNRFSPVMIFTLLLLAFLTLTQCKDESKTDSEQQPVEETKKEVQFWAGDTTDYIHGIDVSHHQDTINWQDVKDYGVTFVFVKATEGIDYLDTMFTHNWNNVEKGNMIRGAYHFYVSDDDPKVQAKWFVDNVKSFESVLPPVIDVERAGHEKVTIKEYQEKLIVLLNEVETLTGRKPLLYSSPNFAAEHLDNDAFKGYELWIAEYGVDAPKIPEPWQAEGWKFWQNSYQATVPGVPKKVDRNRYAGSFSDLVGMVKK